MLFQSNPLGRAPWIAVSAATALLVSACGGGGGGGPSAIPPPAPPAPTPTEVTISGTITFDRIPFDSTAGTGLNPNAPVQSPARGVVVEALSGGSIIATTVTDATGAYSMIVPINTQVSIRAKAQLLKTGTPPTWNFRVLNNTNGNALYALDGSVSTSGTANSTRNLRAPSGWTGSSYGSTRAAAPFAVLDSIYQAREILLTGTGSGAALPALDIYWSPTNVPASPLCPSAGNIGTTSYITGGGLDSCTQPQQIADGIYVLGSTDGGGDTDEFDRHVIAHEFGHYIEAQFSRSDSIGGEHGSGSKLDLRVAFGEGWGNAFSAMALNDVLYRDSFGVASSDFSFNVEQDDTRFADGGWFSEASIQEVLWDVFDATNESGDGVTLGFAPIFNVLSTDQRNTDAFTSIFSFLRGLKEEAPSAAAAIDQLADDEQISGTDDFGAGETNNGGDGPVGSDPGALPIYRTITLGQPAQTVCVKGINGSENKLGNDRFFRLNLASNATVTFTANGAVDPGNPSSQSAQDPDIFVFRRGSIVAAGFQETTPNQTIPQVPLSAGTYIVDVLDAALSNTSTRCMTLSVTGS